MQNAEIIFIQTTKNHRKTYERYLNSNSRSLECDIINMEDIFYNFVLGHSPQPELNRTIKERLFKRFQCFISYLVVSKFKNYLVEFINENYPNVKYLVFLDNYMSFFHALLTSASRQLQISLYCLPYVNPDIEDVITIRTNHKAISAYNSSLLSKYFLIKMPNWYIKHDNKIAFWMHPWQILSLRKIGFDIKKIDPVKGVSPWIEKILVNTEINGDRYIRQFGINPKKIDVIGDIGFDHVYPSQTIRDTFLISICPELNHDIYSGSYLEYLKDYVSISKYIKMNSALRVCIIFHPSVKHEHRKYFSNLEDVTFIDDGIEKVIGRTAVYLTSYSSTIVWANHLDIECIDHDIYNFRYVGNSKLNKVVNVSFHESLLSQVERIIERIKPYTSTSNSCHHLDGLVTSRFEKSLLNYNR